MFARFRFIASLSVEAEPSGPMCWIVLESGSRIGFRPFDDLGIAAQVEHSLPGLRGGFAASERGFEECGASCRHAPRELERPLGGNRARLDDQLAGLQCGAELPEHRIHGRGIRDDHDDRIGAIDGIGDRISETGKLLRCAVPAADFVAVREEIPCPRAANDAEAEDGDVHVAGGTVAEVIKG
jgi:hypothetical protein